MEDTWRDKINRFFSSSLLETAVKHKAMFVQKTDLYFFQFFHKSQVRFTMYSFSYCFVMILSSLIACGLYLVIIHLQLRLDVLRFQPANHELKYNA